MISLMTYSSSASYRMLLLVRGGWWRSVGRNVAATTSVSTTAATTGTTTLELTLIAISHHHARLQVRMLTSLGRIISHHETLESRTTFVIVVSLKAVLLVKNSSS